MTDNADTERPIQKASPKPTPMAIGNLNKLTIDAKLKHVIGVTGNAQRTPVGKIVARVSPASTAGQLTLDLANAITVTGSGDEFQDNRQTVLEDLIDSKTYQLFLEIGGDYLVPLSQKATVVGEEKVKPKEFSAKTWLAPILPKTHADHTLSIEEDQLETLPNGFIYIFIDGHLWREVGIESNEQSDDYKLYEIDLKKDFGNDLRETHYDLQDDVILIPQQVGTQSINNIQIAYSMVQWSWRQIQAYGGLHPDDIRAEGKEQQTSDLAEKLREKRMQKLEKILPWLGSQQWWHCFKDDKADENYHIPKVLLHNPLGIAINNLSNCINALNDLKDEHEKTVAANQYYASGEMIYRVIFDPTLYEFKNQVYDYEKLKNEIFASPVSNGKGFPSKDDYWDYLDEKHPDNHELIQQKRDEFLALRKHTQTKTFDSKFKKGELQHDFIRDLRKNLDEDLLRKTLFPEPLKERIKTLEELRKIYFDWLDNKHDGGIPYTSSPHCSIPFESAFSDLANLSATEAKYNYTDMLHIWNCLMYPVRGKQTILSDLYNNMDRLSPEMHPEKDIGKQWEAKVLDNDNHPLHQMLFACKKLDPHKPYETIDELPEISFDGSGKFRPKDFALAVSELEDTQDENMESQVGGLSQGAEAGATKENEHAQSVLASGLFGEKERKLALGTRVLSDFIGWMNSSIDDIDGKKNPDIKTKRLRAFINIAQASQLEGLKGAHFVKFNGVDSEKYIVLGFNNIREEQVRASRQERRQRFKSEHTVPVSQAIYDPYTKKVISADKLSFDAYSPDNLNTANEGRKVRDMWDASNDKGKISEIMGEVEVIAVSKKNAWAVAAMENSTASGLHKFAAKTPKATSNYIIPLVAMFFEYQTIKSVIFEGSLSDRHESHEQWAKYIAVSSGIITSAEFGVSILKLANKKDLAKTIEDSVFYRGTVKINGTPRDFTFTKLKAGGILVSSALTIFGAIDTYESIKRQDFDAAIFIGLGVLVGASLTAIQIATIIGWLTIPNPVVWTLLAASIALTWAAGKFRDKPLPDWVKHGPFGRHAFSGDYVAWENKPEKVLQSLVGIIMKPTVELGYELDPKTNKHAVVATIDTPAFIVGLDTYEIHTTIEKKPSKHSYGRSFRNRERQEKLEPYRLEIVTNSDETIAKKLRFYYFDSDMLKITTETTWRARIQITSRGMTLPYEYKPGLYDNVPEDKTIEISSDNKNWELSNELKIIGGNKYE